MKISKRELQWELLQINQHCPLLTYLFSAENLLRFTNANRKCVNAINIVLKGFCRASGQAVTKEKSAIYFSKSIGDQEAQRLSAVIGIPRTKNLGLYLGVPIIHD